MNPKSAIRRLRPDSGEALVEMALVLPILLVLSLGMLDFGRAFHQKSIVDAAAREACRVAVVTAPDVPIAEARGNLILTTAGFTGSTAIAGPDPARMVTATVTSEFTFVTPGLFALFGGGFGNSIILTGRSVMRKEG